MADIEQLSRAFMAADKAGDTKSAQLLANAIRELQAGQAQPAAPEPTAQTQAEAPDTSILGALGQGVDQSGAMVGKGIQSAGEYFNVDAIEAYGAEMAQRNEAQLAASNYQRPEGADGIIKNLKEGEYGNAGNSLLYGAAEAAPQVAGGVVASVGAGLAATSAPILGTAAAIGGTVYGTVNALGQMRDEKETQGLDPTATASDLSAAVASGLVELLPIKGGGATLKVIREAGQEAVQEGLVIGNTTVQGGEYVPEEVVNRIGDAAITGGAIAKGVNMSISTVNKAGNIVMRPREDLDPETDQAAGDVARMLGEISKTEGYNLKDVTVSPDKGSTAALDSARSKIRADIDVAVKELRKNILRDAPQEIVSQFNETLRQANNKVSTVVTKENIQFIKDNFGSTKQGQQLAQAYRKSNVVTELYAAGPKGGVSQFTDQFNPLPTFGRSYNPAGMIAGNLGAGAAVLTGGSSLAAQLPILAGGRAIDAVTGRRSKVARFVKKNRKKEGLGPTGGTSIVGMAKARKEAEVAKKLAEKEKQKAAATAKKDKSDEASAATAVRIYKNGLPPNRGDTPDPRGVVYNAIEDSRGRQKLTPRQMDAKIEEILSKAEQDNKNSPETLSSIGEYRMFLASGRMSMEGRPLTEVAALVNGAWDSFVPPKGSKKGTERPPPLPPKQARGKAENEALLATLRDKMEADTSISDADRNILFTAFDDLKMNLGKNPLEGAEGIMGTAVAKLSDPRLAETHLSPYIARVRQQQKAKDAPSQPEPSDPTGNPAPVGTAPVEPAPTPPAGPVLNPEPSPAKPTPKPPSPKQVKKELPQAKAIIEIGKKGSKYENGIQDWEMALEAAKTLGLAVNMFSSNQAMATGAKSAGFGKVTRSTKGFFNPYGSQGGAGGTIFGIKPGGSLKGKRITNLSALTTLLHEIAHGVTVGPLDGEGAPFNRLYMIPQDKTATNKMSKAIRDTYKPGSFVGSSIVPLLSGMNFDINHPVVKEINNLQRNISVTLGNGSKESKSVRDFYKMAGLEHTPRAKKYTKYANNFAEFAVDPVWVYMFDPALAKQVMPETTALIRKEFAKAGNKQIQFYSHPFATILAIVTAIAATGLGDDSEDELPDGALSPSLGVLSV